MWVGARVRTALIAAGMLFAGVVSTQPANAWCVYNNTVDKWLFVRIFETLSLGVQYTVIDGIAPSSQRCLNEPGSNLLFTWKVGVIDDGKKTEFCEMPFSTNETSVTVIDDPNEAIGVRCCRDCGPGWKG